MAMYEIGFRIGSAVGGALSGIRSVGSAITELNQKVAKTNELAAKFGEKKSEYGGKLAAETAVIGAAVAALAYPAAKFEDSMASIGRSVDFANDLELKAFGEDILGMTRHLPANADGLASIALEAKRAGIAKNDLLSFTDSVTRMGTAFEMASTDAAGLSANLLEIYNLPVDNLIEMGDAVNALAKAGNVKESDIMQTVAGFGSSTVDFGLDFDESAMFASAGLSAGIDSDALSSAFNNALTKLGSVDDQSTSFKNALKAMQITPENFKKGKDTDAAQAVIDLLTQLDNYEDDAAKKGVLADIFGDDADIFMSLSKNNVLLKDQLKIIKETNEEGKKKYLGGTEKDYQKMVSTTTMQLKFLRNSITEIGIVVGSALLPPIKNLITSIRPVVESFADWAKENPKLVEGGLKVAGVVVGLRLGFLALNFATFVLISNGFKLFAGLQKGWGLVRIGVSVVGTLATVLKGALLGSLKLVGNAIVWLGRAMMMNPIGAAITGIAVAAFLVYKYWEPIKNFFINVWNTVKTAFDGGIGEVSRLIVDWSPLGLFHKAFAGVMSWFGVDIPSSFTDFGSMMIGDFIDSALATWDSTKRFFGDVVSFIQSPFNALPADMQTFGVDVIDGFMGGAKTIWEGAKGFFTGIVDFIKNPFGTIGETFSGYGENIIDGVVGGVGSKLAAAKETITNVGNSIKGWFTSVLGIQSPSRVFMGYGENITEGAAIGIENALPDAKKAIDKLSDEMELTPSSLSSKSGSVGSRQSDALSSPQNNTASAITITFSPTINANDVSGVKDALKISQAELERMMNDIMRKNQRRSYA